MKSVPLTIYPRKMSGRLGVKKLRAQGRVPAVMYGRHNAPQNLEVDYKAIDTLIKHSFSENLLVDLSTQDDGGRRLAIIKEVQHHPLTGLILHVDFQELVENEPVTITVPIESLGESVGVKVGGGVLEHVLFNMKVRGLPKDLPEVIQVDVSNLNIGQSLHIGDLPLPPGVEVVGDKKIVVMSVAQGRTEAEEATPEAASAAAAAAASEAKK